MTLQFLAPGLSISPQLTPADLAALKRAGVRAIICNRPDGEAADQPSFALIAQLASANGMAAHYLPAPTGQVGDDHARAFAALLATLPQPVHAYCRSGMRSATMWALSQAPLLSPAAIVAAGQHVGLDLAPLTPRLTALARPPQPQPQPQPLEHGSYDVVIVGAGAAGVATAASLLARRPGLDIAIIDPADTHYYQPGWTMVGAGVFQPEATARPLAATLPRGVHWIKAAVSAFEPERNAVIVDGGQAVGYRQLVVCPGLTLDWQAIEGLGESVGRNGVTSNYRYDLAPYTWQQVQQLRGGQAIFTQPAMPIKCAGAPQKAMYLSACHWRRHGVLDQIEIDFCSAGAVLFGVPDYVPALMEYVDAYGINLNFGDTLVAVDGARRSATFERTGADGARQSIKREFDLLHVVPPQVAPTFLRRSPLANAAGWVDVDPATLRHLRYDNVHALGDAAGTSNAKTAAAARKQAPVVAHNVLAALGKAVGGAVYDGYGSCPLTVERGKIVLAEFTYGGKVAPSFPAWLLDGTRPSRLAWLLKERILPPLYWHGMLKGREWMAAPPVGPA